LRNAAIGGTRPARNAGERHPDAETESSGDRDHRDRDCLDHDRTDNLAATGADGTEQREITRALGDDDRERVVDDEHPDEQRDHREREQERVEERQVLSEL
jgi:hypothetical protein